MNLDIELTEESLNEAIMAIEIYRDSLDNKANQLVKEVARVVEDNARSELLRHIETGETISSLNTTYKQNMYGQTATVSCGGAAVWLEFGTGVVANDCAPGEFVHPMPGVYFKIDGIGTHGQGHGADPNGWWYYDENGRRRHTYGIPATMFMYYSAQRARREMPYLARRIFR